MERFRLRAQMMVEGDPDTDEWILIDGHVGAMFSCNAAAGVMLGLLEQGVTRGELSACLARRFGISREAAERDAARFLDALSRVGAIEVLGAGEAADSGALAARPGGELRTEPLPSAG